MEILTCDHFLNYPLNYTVSSVFVPCLSYGYTDIQTAIFAIVFFFKSTVLTD